jgi:hypothetical protein
MVMKDICFWSIADGEYAFILQTLVDSYRNVGMPYDFYAFCDRNISGAILHPIETFDKSLFIFKYTFLRKYIKELDYRYFVYLDADNFFVRQPPPLLDLMQKSTLHTFLECDCTQPSKRKEWQCCPLPEYVSLMRECGVMSEKIYNVNGGFFMVKREAIDLMCDLMEDFWKYSFRKGYVLTDEAPLAYATHMLCADPQQHLLKFNPHYWCSDWTGCFAGRLPDGNPWMFADYMTYEPFSVNPAIVHAIKSKDALISKGKSLLSSD